MSFLLLRKHIKNQIQPRCLAIPKHKSNEENGQSSKSRIITLWTLKGAIEKFDPNVINLDLETMLFSVPNKKIVERMTQKPCISIFFDTRVMSMNMWIYIYNVTYVNIFVNNTYTPQCIIITYHSFKVFLSETKMCSILEYANLGILVSNQFINFCKLFNQFHIGINTSCEIWPHNNGKLSEGNSVSLFYSLFFSLTSYKYKINKY